MDTIANSINIYDHTNCKNRGSCQSNNKCTGPGTSIGAGVGTSTIHTTSASTGNGNRNRDRNGNRQKTLFRKTKCS